MEFPPEPLGPIGEKGISLKLRIDERQVEQTPVRKALLIDSLAAHDPDWGGLTREERIGCGQGGCDLRIGGLPIFS